MELSTLVGVGRRNHGTYIPMSGPPVYLLALPAAVPRATAGTGRERESEQLHATFAAFAGSSGDGASDARLILEERDDFWVTVRT